MDQKLGYRLAYQRDTPRGYSPYRLLDASGNEIAEVNEFLDAQATRGLSPRSLRAYGYSLLNFWRWFGPQARELSVLKEADLYDYIRFQQQGDGHVAPKTINHRLTAVQCLYRFHCGRDMPRVKRAWGPTHPYHSSVASEHGYLYPCRPRSPGLRVKIARRVVIPLTREEVGDFLESFRTWRDLSIVTLMLLCGLRSREVIELKLNDVSVGEGQLRVRGKGRKERLVPVPPQVLSLVQTYLEVERPRTQSDRLFVSLKAPKRGQPMQASGLRSLFRYHRKISAIVKANPHRFRHTFGTDMVRAGMPVAALKELMGHGDIHTTMIYVELSPKDVWEEFHRVCKRLPKHRLAPKVDPDETEEA